MNPLPRGARRNSNSQPPKSPAKNTRNKTAGRPTEVLQTPGGDHIHKNVAKIRRDLGSMNDRGRKEVQNLAVNQDGPKSVARRKVTEVRILPSRGDLEVKSSSRKRRREEIESDGEQPTKRSKTNESPPTETSDFQVEGFGSETDLATAIDSSRVEIQEQMRRDRVAIENLDKELEQILEQKINIETQLDEAKRELGETKEISDKMESALNEMVEEQEKQTAKYEKVKAAKNQFQEKLNLVQEELKKTERILAELEEKAIAAERKAEEAQSAIDETYNKGKEVGKEKGYIKGFEEGFKEANADAQNTIAELQSNLEQANNESQKIYGKLWNVVNHFAELRNKAVTNSKDLERELESARGETRKATTQWRRETNRADRAEKRKREVEEESSRKAMKLKRDATIATTVTTGLIAGAVAASSNASEVVGEQFITVASDHLATESIKQILPTIHPGVTVVVGAVGAIFGLYIVAPRVRNWLGGNEQVTDLTER